MSNYSSEKGIKINEFQILKLLHVSLIFKFKYFKIT